MDFLMALAVEAMVREFSEEVGINTEVGDWVF
jgi:8-oxo-dGTP pyrophosphatase MutT (NUDIX family)